MASAFVVPGIDEFFDPKNFRARSAIGIDCFIARKALCKGSNEAVNRNPPDKNTPIVALAETKSSLIA
jgi:hypothetical protein